MENKKRIGRKIVLTVCSMIFCMVLMGVSVYAALSQNVQLTNTISVNTSGQVKSTVEVYEHIFDGVDAVTAMPTEPTWGTAVLEKAEDEDSKTQALTPIVFSQSTGKNIYAYKIVVTNKSTVGVNVTITSTEETDEQIDVYAGETFATLAKLDNNAKVNFTTSERLGTDDALTYYIVVCANKALGDMTAITDGSGVTSEPFDINVVVAA